MMMWILRVCIHMCMATQAQIWWCREFSGTCPTVIYMEAAWVVEPDFKE